MASKRTRTLDIVVPLSGKGGVENVIDKTACYLMEHGWQVRVVQMVYNGPAWLSESVPFYPLRKAKVNDILDFIPMYAQFMGQTYAPDIAVGAPWPYMALAVRKALEQLDARTKVVAWVHGPLEMYKKYEVGGAECLGFADKIFVLNERTRRLLGKLLPQVPAELVRNPVDFLKCREIVPEHHRCLLFVGRLSEEKRVSLILEAVAASDGWRIKIIGNGPERTALEEYARQAGLADRVEFLGWQSNPWEHAQGVDALVMASEYEAFPLAAIEAMACGLPVFSTPVDGIVELIRPGENGFLFERGNSGALAQLLDLYAQGKLPQVDGDTCRKSVQAYEAKRALSDLTCSLESMLDKLSVIIPCYNVSDCLTECLESIFSHDTDIELEVICVEDRSTDNTLEILLEWENRYPQQLMVIPLQEHCGRDKAKEVALQYATGNVVLYIDANEARAQDVMRQALGEICG